MNLGDRAREAVTQYFKDTNTMILDQVEDLLRKKLETEVLAEANKGNRYTYIAWLKPIEVAARDFERFKNSQRWIKFRVDAVQNWGLKDFGLRYDAALVAVYVEW